MAAVVPGAEVAEVALDHFGCVGEFRLDHVPGPTSLLTVVAVGVQSFDSEHDFAAVAPAVEVPRVEAEHLAHEAELGLPECDCAMGGEVLGGGAEEPGAVVPDPVAFGVLFEEGD